MNTKLPLGKYIFEWGGLIENAGGMTRAMLKRANMFISAGIRPTILLSARGYEQYDNVKHYQENGYPLIQESDFICMEDYFGKKLMNDESGDTANRINELKELPWEKESNYRIYFKDGVIYAKEEDVSERYKKIQIFDENGKYIYTEHYWKEKLSRRIYPISEDKNVEKYYASNGFCFLSIQNFFEKGKWIAKNIILLNQRNKSVKRFSNMDVFREFFFSEYVNACKEDTFVFCDPFLDFQPGFKYMDRINKKVYRIGINHGNGLGEERKWYSKINPRIKSNIIDAFPPEIEGFVLLTKEAVSDFKKRLGDCDFLYNVPNTITIPSQISNIEERDLNKIVYIGRFAEKQKQISHIIKAFAIAAQKNDKLHLHLYGRGEDEALYQKTINELKLNDKVFIEGFSNETSNVFQSAGIAMFASDWEGFCLSLAEAMANGCVPISYDFSYGPKDIITDGVDGLIVPKNNIEALAEKIIFLSEKHELIIKMSGEAYKSVQKFNEKMYMENWIAVLNSIVEKYPYHNNINDMEVTIDKMLILPHNNAKEIEMTASVIGSIPEIAKNNYRFFIRMYNSQRTEFDVTECNVIESEKQKFTLKAVLPNKSNGEICVCLEWNNSFIEKKCVCSFVI